MAAVSLTLRSTTDWSGIAKCHQLVRLFQDVNHFFLPERMDDKEPERHVYDPKNLGKLEQLWTSPIRMVNFKRRKPHLAWTRVWMWPREARRFNELAGGIDERYVKKEGGTLILIDFLRRFAAWGQVTHGFICHEQDWYEKNYFGVPTPVAGGVPVMTGGLKLEEGLPGLYWANVFGPSYVDLLGRDRFQSCPAYYREELPDGGFILLTAASPLDYAVSSVRAFEQKIIAHLGRDAFFEKARPGKTCRSPQFLFEQALLGESLEVISFDPVTELIPDPEGFVGEAAALAQTFAARFMQPLDFSPASLDEVDQFTVKKAAKKPEPWKKEADLRLVRELAAYYGEVLRRSLNGRWTVIPGSGGAMHPAIEFPARGRNETEYPLTRVFRLWAERQRSDGLAPRFYILRGWTG